MISNPAGDTFKFETDQGLLERFLWDGGSILGRKTLKTSQFQCTNDSVTSQICTVVWKILSVNRFMGEQIPHPDLQTTHALCPRACFTGCSYQTRMRFAEFTV
jgi:hypothetical protein